MVKSLTVIKTAIVTALLLLISFIDCFSNTNSIYSPTKISIKIIDSLARPDEKLRTVISVSKFPFGGIEAAVAGANIYEKEIFVNETRNFKIESPSQIFYIRIYYYREGISGKFWWLDNIYIITAGSNMACTLTPSFINFHGKGSEIPKLQSRIYNHVYVQSDSDISLLRNKQYGIFLKTINSRLDSSLALQLKDINENKRIIGPKMTELLTANCYGLRYYTLYRYFNQLGRADTIYFKSIQKYYLERLPSPVLNLSSEAIINSPICANFLFQQLVLSIKLEENFNNKMTDKNIIEIINRIRSQYSGQLREKLFCLFFLEKNASSLIYKYIDEILPTISNKCYREIFLRLKESRSVGKIASDFLLKDTTGRNYTFRDFTNKVVVMDFWYTGCKNCIILNENMKDVYQYFRDKKNVVFVSVCIDKSKEMWKKSIKSGLYTHEGSLNLYTNGEGQSNDLIKYYHITSYPFLLILKNGRVFSINPTRPEKLNKESESMSEKTQNFIRLLE